MPLARSPIHTTEHPDPPHLAWKQHLPMFLAAFSPSHPPPPHTSQAVRTWDTLVHSAWDAVIYHPTSHVS